MRTWDTIVVGGGAAGLSAAAAIAQAGLSCLIMDRMGGGGELMNLGRLHGLEEALTGPDLAAHLLEQAIGAGADLDVSEVTTLTEGPTGWRVSSDSDTHAARAVILAAGLGPGTLHLDNEKDFEGLGLSHCAACDGPLYAGQPVVVAGADRWAIQEATELAAIASAVTLICQGAPPPPPPDRVTVIDGRITALHGSDGLCSVTVLADAMQRPLPARAVFIQTHRRPALDFAPAGLTRDADGRIVTDSARRTSLAGLYAAGDGRAGTPRTLTAAMEDGRLAGASVVAALNSHC